MRCSASTRSATGPRRWWHPRLLCAATALVLCVSVAEAEPVSLQFLGTIDSVEPEAAGAVALGDPITVVVTFDDVQIDALPISYGRSYLHTGPPYGITASVNDVFLHSLDSLSIRVTDTRSPTHSDSYHAYELLDPSRSSSHAFVQTGIDQISLRGEGEADAILRASLPRTPEDLAAFDTFRFWAVGWGGDIDPGGTPFTAELGPPQLVPEPSVPLGTGFGAALVWWLERRRRRRSR